jgi:signal transduction histidine kinase
MTTRSPGGGRRSLTVRLAIVIACGVVAVLLLTGILVNRAVDRSVADSLSSVQQGRLQVIVTSIEELRAADLPLTHPSVRRLLRRMANVSGGSVALIGADGAVIASFGAAPANAELIRQALSERSGGGLIEMRIPRQELPFLRAFNLALLIGGIASVLAIVGIAVVSADRITRPLRELGAVAHRLGEGDLTVRAVGGPDRESTELAAAFNAMAGRLEQSEQLRRRAASDIAHDLATPATVLESQLQAMADHVIPAGQAEIEQARSAAAALSGLVAQLGELAGAEAAGLHRHGQPVALGGLVGDVIGSLEAMMRDAAVAASADGEATAIADPGQLERAVRNVIANAVQHSPRGGAIEIAIAPDGAACVIRVRDEGTGIAPGDVPHVFDRFYRADPARAGGRGSGLGLTIARELLSANGGSIVVEATGASGTTFAIRLPAA